MCKMLIEGEMEVRQCLAVLNESRDEVGVSDKKKKGVGVGE